MRWFFCQMLRELSMALMGKMTGLSGPSFWTKGFWVLPFLLFSFLMFLRMSLRWLIFWPISVIELAKVFVGMVSFRIGCGVWLLLPNSLLVVSVGFFGFNEIFYLPKKRMCESPSSEKSSHLWIAASWVSHLRIAAGWVSYGGFGRKGKAHYY